MISQAPCPDCWDFLARLELVLGLEITVFAGDTRLGEEGSARSSMYGFLILLTLNDTMTSMVVANISDKKLW
jgi:hypothetical protein